MFARLWWKDARQFWPIWVVLILGAAGTQWVILSFVGRDARYGGLGISALVWASLYALTAGAAAFAGEREAGTLRLLDILPADRRVVWAGKVSFGLVTSVALTVLLLAMAAWSTERWNPHEPLTALQACCCSMLVLVALGWGLFWSSILKVALNASLAAICCIGLTVLVVWGTYNDLYFRHRPDATAVAGLAEVFIIGITLAASEGFFSGRPRLRRIPIEFRSPIVVKHALLSRPSEIPLPTRVAPVRIPEPRPMPVARTPEASAAISPVGRSWLVEARMLAGQTIKQGMKIWLLLAAIALVPPVLTIIYQSYFDSFWLGFVCVLVALVTGASVFGLENRERTHRFLAHHGARPGLVWFVKILVWATGVAVIGGALAFLCSMLTIAGPVGRGDHFWTQFGLVLAIAFVVAMLCGMAFRRGIMALVLGLVFAFTLAMPLLILVATHMLPATGLVFVPVALGVVSWAWKKDWMLERPAPGRWLRLGTLLGSALAILSACYIGFRVWSIPEVGPIAEPAAWHNASAAFLSSDQNAAGLYREAGRRLIGPVGSPEFLSLNKESLDLIRLAAALPDCWFEHPDERTLFDPAERQPVDSFARLVSLEADKRLRQGDFAGSWDDIMVLFQMARHFSEGSGGTPGIKVLTVVERDALGLALEWAVARGQTTERLQAALAAYRESSKPPPAADVLRAEANVIENTLELPPSKLRDGLAQLLYEGNQQEGNSWQQTVVPSWASTPWELARARRVNRVISANAIRIASSEPTHRPASSPWGGDDSGVRYAWESTPRLILGLFWNWEFYLSADDHNEVGRRALEQILAIRAWQLRHGGQFPDRLELLLKEGHTSPPKDPYSDGRFGWVPSRGKRVPRLRDALVQVSGNTPASRDLVVPPPGSWLLYSVGPNRNDDTTSANSRVTGSSPWPNDIIFVIPPVEGSSESGKGRGDAEAKDRPTSSTAPPAGGRQ